MSNVVTVNRAPVLTLWAAVVAERLGFTWDEALTLGRTCQLRHRLGDLDKRLPATQDIDELLNVLHRVWSVTPGSILSSMAKQWRVKCAGTQTGECRST